MYRVALHAHMKRISKRRLFQCLRQPLTYKTDEEAVFMHVMLCTYLLSEQPCPVRGPSTRIVAHPVYGKVPTWEKGTRDVDRDGVFSADK